MNADRLSGGVLFVLALGVSYQALDLPFGSLSTPDSGFFPRSLAVLLLLLAAIILGQTFAAAAAPAPLPTGRGMPRVALAAVILLGYTQVLDRLGYLVATLVVMLVLLRGLERASWRASLIVAVLSVAASYMLFRWLGVPLPRGIVPV